MSTVPQTLEPPVSCNSNGKGRNNGKVKSKPKVLPKPRNTIEKQNRRIQVLETTLSQSNNKTNFLQNTLDALFASSARKVQELHDMYTKELAKKDKELQNKENN
jgi:predicted RNase H-like nuclease (RuvC/YqgF family)